MCTVRYVPPAFLSRARFLEFGSGSSILTVSRVYKTLCIKVKEIYFLVIPFFFCLVTYHVNMAGTPLQYRTVNVLLLHSIDQECLKTIGNWKIASVRQYRCSSKIR